MAKKKEKQPEKQKVVLYRAILHTDGFTVDEKEAEEKKLTEEELKVITDYMQYLEYLAKWDGKLPTVVAGESATIMIPTPSTGEESTGTGTPTNP